MNLRRRAVVPLSLGLGMLGVVVAAGLSPNTGVVRAASNCTYGQCVASQPPFPLWAVAVSVAAVVVALLLTLLLLRRRRRPGQPPSEWQGPGGSGGGPSGDIPRADLAPVAGTGAVAGSTVPAWHEGTSHDAEPEETPAEPESLPPTGGPSGGMPEEPEAAVSAPPLPPPAPSPGSPTVRGGPAPTPKAAEPAAEEGEPDIDSLMSELEKISGEILKKGPKKRATTTPAGGTADDASA